MMHAITHLNPVLGVDVHIIQPPGPVPPVPIPHPYVGIVFDPADYVPIIGSTVSIHGLPRAIAGTAGKPIPSHIPIGGTFIKPPGNEDEDFMGSSTVAMDGDAASYMALPVISCQDVGMPPPFRTNPKKKGKMKSMVLPTGVMIPIPAGPPVLIGGSPTISLMALGMRFGMAALGRGLRRLARTNLARRAGAAFRRVRQRLFRNMRPGFLKCRILRAEPVDVVTGEVVVDQQDFSIPGRIPIEWKRHYGSRNERMGVCGYGWETPADARLEIDYDDGSVLFHDGTGAPFYFESLPIEGPVQEAVDGCILQFIDNYYSVRLKGGLTYYFPIPKEPVEEIIVEYVMDICRNSLHYVLDEGGLREITESAGRRIEVKSQNGLILEMQLRHPDYNKPHPLVRFDYSKNGDLVTVFDALNNPYRLYYKNHRLIQHANRNELSFYYEYDEYSPDGRCVHTWGDGGLYDYRFKYNDLEGRTEFTDSLAHTWRVEYNNRHMITKGIDPLGGATKYEYDNVGRASAVIDPAGNHTEYEYDERGNLVMRTDAAGGTIQSEYSDRNRIIKITTPTLNIWRQVWNSRGLLEKRISPKGREWKYFYNNYGDPIKFVNPLGAITNVRTNQYGMITEMVDAMNRSMECERDFFGNAVSIRQAGGVEFFYQFDKAGRLVRTSNHRGWTTEHSYDKQGNLITVRDAHANVTQIRYMGLRQIAERIKPDSSSVRYEYDTEERLIGVINQRGEHFIIERDALGRVVRCIDYWKGMTHYWYNSASNLTKKIDPLNRVTLYEYDPVGRSIKKTYDDGTSDEFFYDISGYRIGLKNDLVSIERKFDEEHFLIEEIQGDFKCEYKYDLQGNRISRLSSHGNTINYEYDNLNRLVAIRANGRQILSIERDVSGKVVRELLYRNLVRHFDVEKSKDETQTRDKLLIDSRPFLTSSYRFDQLGNLMERTDSHKGNDLFEYDSLGQIKRYTDSQQHVSEFSYDSAGDLLRTVQIQVESDHRFRTMQYADRTYVFDRAGNLSERHDPENEFRFLWDNNNRLVQVDYDVGGKVTMGYDPTGRRLFKKTDETHTIFRWDGDKYLSESNNNIGTREFIFYPRSFIPFALMDENGQIFYFRTDRLGLPHEVYNANGEVVWSASYGAFGEVRKTYVDKFGNQLRFAGQYFDSEMGLSYTRNRYYDPKIKSFISQDPFGLNAGTNLYSYAPNPWRWWDPYGLTCLYRADTRGPDEIFRDGFQPKGDDPDLHRYVCDGDTDSVFVSGSRTEQGALEAMESTQEVLPGDYVYEMDVPDSDAIDVNDWIESSGGSNPFHHEEEFAIPGGVEGDQIVGAREVLEDGSLGDLIPNPNF